MKILKEDKGNILDLYDEVSKETDIIYSIKSVVNDIQKDAKSIADMYERFVGCEYQLIKKGGSTDSTSLKVISHTIGSLNDMYNELFQIRKDLTTTRNAIKPILSKTYDEFLKLLP